MSKGIQENNTFALYVSKKSESTTSRFWLGGYNPEYVDQNTGVTFHPVIQKDYWTLKLDKVLINDEDSLLCQSDSFDETKSCSIIIDSGTSSMALPQSMYDPFDSLQKVYGNSESVESWPEIKFVISGKTYIMPPQAYTLVNGYEADMVNVKPGDIVQSGFSPIDFGNDRNIWIAGDSFLRQYLSIFDRDNDMIGFAIPDHERIAILQSEEVSSQLSTNIE